MTWSGVSTQLILVFVFGLMGRTEEMAEYQA